MFSSDLSAPSSYHLLALLHGQLTCTSLVAVFSPFHSRPLSLQTSAPTACPDRPMLSNLSSTTDDMATGNTPADRLCRLPCDTPTTESQQRKEAPERRTLEGRSTPHAHKLGTLTGHDVYGIKCSVRSRPAQGRSKALGHASRHPAAAPSPITPYTPLIRPSLFVLSFIHSLSTS